MDFIFSFVSAFWPHLERWCCPKATWKRKKTNSPIVTRYSSSFSTMVNAKYHFNKDENLINLWKITDTKSKLWCVMLSLNLLDGYLNIQILLGCQITYKTWKQDCQGSTRGGEPFLFLPKATWIFIMSFTGHKKLLT